MSGPQSIYLAMVIISFLAFMATVAYGSIVTWQVHRLEQSKRADTEDRRDAA